MTKRAHRVLIYAGQAFFVAPILYFAWVGSAHVWKDHWNNHVTMANQQQIIQWIVKTDAELRKAGVKK